jgi:hypothetical protein
MYILAQKIFTDTAIPGWASSLILIISGISILQLFSHTHCIITTNYKKKK